MELTEIISAIQNSQCCNCKFGKALIALKGLDEKTETTPPESHSAIKISRRKQKVSSKGNGREPGKKACKKCGHVKSLSEFNINKQTLDGHEGKCKKCRYAEAKARQKAKLKNESSSDPDDKDKLECHLCHALCSSQGRLNSHMRTVHDMNPI